MVYQYVWMFARRYMPFVMLPVAIVVGTIGYNIERIVSDRHTPSPGLSIEQKRQERNLSEMTSDPLKVESLKSHTFVSGSVFTKNVSPSLQSK